MRPRRYRPPWARILLEAVVSLGVYVSVLLIGGELFPGRAGVIIALVAMIITLTILRAKRPKPR
jgi:hypothetical protein